MPRSSPLDRRSFLDASRRAGLALALGAGSLPAEAVAELLATPGTTEGPFYPDRLPLDTDNDLLVINDSNAHAIGEVTHLTGRLLSRAGEPVRNAVIEVWQCDASGAYLHSRGESGRGRDAGFQGYGRFLTDSKGRYYFRTIKPVPYPGRTPHIHVAVSRAGRRELTSQLFIAGEPQNDRDGIYQGFAPEERKLVTAEFRPLEGSKIGELTASCDLVLGRTPSEGDDGKFPGLIAKPERWRS
jgi:protocatechuate 3,4-dioxygenase, beta subunit